MSDHGNILDGLGCECFYEPAPPLWSGDARTPWTGEVAVSGVDVYLDGEPAPEDVAKQAINDFLGDPMFRVYGCPVHLIPGSDNPRMRLDYFSRTGQAEEEPLGGDYWDTLPEEDL